MSLKEYNRKRRFDRTPEPKGKKSRGRGALRFCVQLHAATRLHYDLRLEMGGAFRSWAVPKGPSLNPMDQRLAVFVEDHPLAYGSFEGVIPSGNYGAGTVMLWDEGTLVERGSKTRAESEAALLAGLEKGHITFLLEGKKLRGEFALVRLKKGEEKTWLLVKKRDEHASSKRAPLSNLSVKTGRDIAQIARESEKRGDIWLPKGPKAAGKSLQTKKPARLPRGVKPALPVVTKSSTERSDWLYEGLANDGIRALAEVVRGRAEIFSRSRLPLHSKNPEIARALAGLDRDLVLDGEIVGRTYRVFDVLYSDGHDLREQPLSQRRSRLEALGIFDKTILLSDARKGNAAELPKRDFDFVLARELSSPYRSGVSRSWLRFANPRAGATKTKGTASDGPRLTHLEKIYWPHEGYTKGDVIEYYRAVAPLILPHLEGRPQSLNRHPNGITQPGFFQKDMSGYLPRFVRTQRIYSESSQKSVNYLVCDDEPTLLYMANLGCVELNPWISTVAALENPTYCVIDLDPDGNPFSDVVKIALAVREVLESIGAKSHCKTSGGDGLHIVVPLGGRFDFDASRIFAEAVCRVVESRHPRLTSLERSPGKRRGKIYLDHLQNRRGQTLASVYGLRPRLGAPVSTPLRWEELKPRLNPLGFNIRTALKRFEHEGDLWKPILKESVDIDRCLAKLRKTYGTA